jgi:pimeloyl-ACP methyl ester carboxylesterase
MRFKNDRFMTMFSMSNIIPATRLIRISFIIILLSPLFVLAQKGPRVTKQTISNGRIFQVTQIDTKYTFDSARYTVFIPEGIATIEGILVHQHGCTMEGRGSATAYDIQYQAFAKKWKLAIIGPDLYDAKNNCHDWKNAGSGTADALLKTLRDVAKAAGHAELNDVPWLLWGHSGGGYWAQSMMQEYASRIMAVFSYSPGLDASWEYPKEALKVPVMIRHAGPVGDACCWKTALNSFRQLRSAGGYAGITNTPFQNHNYSFVRYLAIPFYESILVQRMPVGKKKNFKDLRDIDVSKAWLGDTSSLNIYRAVDYPGNKTSASWLPDSAIAMKWREYSITGTIVDRTPPPAPYEIMLNRRHNVTVGLSWKADADIESGISHFNIYKDNQLVGRFPSSGSYQYFDTNGDDAYPLLLPPLQTEITYLWNETGKITISTVNHFGLESARAAVQ